LTRVESEIDQLGVKFHAIELRQESCESFCEKTEASYDAFTKFCNQRLEEMAQEFREAVNQLIAHHASLMRGMRQDFGRELDAAKSLNEDVKKMETQAHKYCMDVKGDLQTQTKHFDSMHKQLVQEFEDSKGCRRKDRQTYEKEMDEVRRDMATHQEVVNSFHANLANLSRVLGLVLEGQRVTSALNVQDYVDRMGEHWLGRPEDAERRAQTATTADMLEKIRHRSPGQPDGDPGMLSMNHLVPIDPRQGLAKLGYVPGRISYGGSQYDRQDMLLVHNRLLTKARVAFQRESLPTSASMKDEAAGISTRDCTARSSRGMSSMLSVQPSAIGSTGGSNGFLKLSGRLKNNFGSLSDGFSEDGKSSSQRFSSTGSFKRPGSKEHRPGSGSTGQPQGTGSRGSRGTVFGTLGETEPPDHPDGHRPEGVGFLGPLDESLEEKSIDSPRDRGNGSNTSRKSGVRLPVIEGMGSGSGPGQPSTTEAATSGSMRCHTAR
jgi:hypothetical protein